MKKWISSIIMLSIFGVLIIGCTWVGAMNLPRDTKHIDNEAMSPSEIEDIINKNNTNDDKTKVEENIQDEKIDIDIGLDPKDELIEDNKITDETKDKDKIDSSNEKNSPKNRVYYSGDDTKKFVALTFDDGPDSKYTSEIVDILEEYNIKATFFVIGENAKRYPEVLKFINEKGHEIGNHSWSHKYLPKLSTEVMKKEVLMAEEVIRDTIGENEFLLFRPPYGAVKDREKQLLSSLEYNIVNWSVDTRDWAGTSGEQMMEYVKEQLKPGGIILMHSGGNPKSIKNTVESLPKIIEWIIEQEYEFVTVSKILNL